MALTQVDPGLLNTQAQYTGFKNRIINGLMMISQRGTSFSTPASGTYTLDRWLIGWNGAAPASVAQVAGPTGYKNALQITGAASNTLTGIQQRIESLNCSDLSGANITFQANIATSSNQTVAWYLFYPNSADAFNGTLTQIATGTWSTTSTATTFTATVSNLPSGATNGLFLGIYPNNAGAFTSGTITITGVQLEKGSTATSFDYRPYGTELSLCQRYYETVGYDSQQGLLLPCGCATAASQQINTTLVYKVTKRATPTVTKNGTWTMSNFASQPNVIFAGVDTVLFYANSSAAGQAYGQNSSAGTYISISAEL